MPDAKGRIMEPQELLNRIESLVVAAYNSGEPDLAFILASTAGCYERDLTADIAAAFSNLLGEDGTQAMMERIAEEAERAKILSN
ncbi:hypothetical protein ACXR0O_13995 [Verrucomicrobiota bacterium sgz303538]